MARTVAGDIVSTAYQNLTENLVKQHGRRAEMLARRVLDPRDIDRSFAVFLPQMEAMGYNLSDNFALISSRFVSTFAEVEGVAMNLSVREYVEEFDADSFRKRMVGAGVYAYKRELSKAGKNMAQSKVDAEFSKIVSNLGRDFSTHALRAGRTTVTNAVRESNVFTSFSRNTNSGACDFCLMLATRNNYRSEKTASFEAHGNCKCSPEPVVRGWSPAPQNLEAYENFKEKQAELNERYGAKDTRERLRKQKEKAEEKPAGEKISKKEALQSLLG